MSAAEGSQLRRGSRNFSKGRLRRKILKEKCLLIHVSTRVHIKTRQTCNSFSLLPFQEDCLLFFALFYYSLLFLFERGGCNSRNPLPLYPPMYSRSVPECISCALSSEHFLAFDLFDFQFIFLSLDPDLYTRSSNVFPPYRSGGATS